MPQSDPTLWSNVLKYGWLIFAFVFGKQLQTNKELHGRISSLKDDVSDFKLKVATENATKVDFKDLIREIRHGFESLEKKIDNKADK